MTTITPLPMATDDVALADEQLIGLVFAAVVVAFLVGLFLF